LGNGIGKFVNKLSAISDKHRKNILETGSDIKPDEAALLRLTITSYARIAKFAEETETTVHDISNDAEPVGRKVANALLKNNGNGENLFKRITDIRVSCLDTAYSIEMTEDERKRIIVVLSNYLDGLLSGLICELKENSSKPSEGNDLNKDTIGYPFNSYLELFRKFELPAVILDRTSVIKNMNEAAESFFDIDLKNAIQRRCSDILGLKIGNLIEKFIVSKQDSTRCRTRIELHGNDVIVDVQTIIIGGEPDYAAMVFYDITEFESLKMQLFNNGRPV
jgi:hypothetical protein